MDIISSSHSDEDFLLDMPFGIKDSQHGLQKSDRFKETMYGSRERQNEKHGPFFTFEGGYCEN